MVKLLSGLAPSGSDTPPLIRSGLGNGVRTLYNTTPGIDGLNARIIQSAQNAASAEFAAVSTNILDGCNYGVPAELDSEAHVMEYLNERYAEITVPGRCTNCRTYDDANVMIGGESRSTIEEKSRITLEAISEWSGRNRLEFTSAKSQTMTMTETLQQSLKIRLSIKPIRTVSSASVLGVVLDVSPSFAQHATSIVERASRCFSRLARICAASWSMSYKVLRVVQGMFIATVTYGANCWVDCVSTYMARSNAERAAISTNSPHQSGSVSMAALSVLTGLLPADLKIICAERLDLSLKPQGGNGDLKKKPLG
ncbi:Putative 115 kDa protein in type-1 retrotransposable element R1DM [Eumeta japonica]|uniref:115 kDa protein in type-1 retrotransposable element R1DM n=1 Tax=Eumeta variegata TaxID=151549 RepID=A0A4C1XX02_EUMVA|nr:Putative 115 kDa protein in type-1 retrotransposable element R1DM [Eumeta japonica]